MKVKTPQYNGKDNVVMTLVVIPFTIIINSIILGSQYFFNWKIFLLATVITFIATCIDFMLCGFIAVALKKRFPEESRLFLRLSLMIFTFLLISGLFLYSLFHGFELIDLFNYRFDENAFTWSYYALGISNIFITFLMEGIARYKDWKQNWMETERLNEVYKQTQLNGLKSQVNPHFLFNSLNSLSGLIQDDEEKAEKFLDEMSKVYRYMLRNDNEQLVSLATELSFVRSYVYVLNTRYGSGLQISIDIKESSLDKLLAPLTLQVVIENSFSLNIVSKSTPLHIHISGDDNRLVIENNIQPKTITDALDFEAGLDNLIRKYELLNMPVSVNDNSAQRVIYIPLFKQKEEVAI
ncbi:MAG TPA: histidine kinase [Ferruginibacter sp.]|nr:histidine kinase [Ferruginibacter sp.]HPH92011.1 histidine kinase [Ferruginibacter sp.]